MSGNEPDTNKSWGKIFLENGKGGRLNFSEVIEIDKVFSEVIKEVTNKEWNDSSAVKRFIFCVKKEKGQSSGTQR